MKTKILIILICLYLLSSFTSAQNLQLQSVDLNFCNNWINSSELDLTAKAWDIVPICIKITNTSKTKIILNIDFLDSIITQDNDKLRACNGWDRPKQYFGNFMLDYDKTISISWNSSFQKTYNIQLPIWFKWLSHGCVAYNQMEESKKWGSMVNIVVRKVNFVDIFVWDTQIKSQIQIWSIKTIKNWKITNFQIWLKNIWNVNQKASFSGIISSIFWFKKKLTFSQNTVKIEQNKQTTIETDNTDLVLPPYGWPFRVSFDITNKPNFDFNIKENDTVPASVILWWNFKISKIIFIVNPYFIWILVIFLILIYLAFFKKRKKTIITWPIINAPNINN